MNVKLINEHALKPFYIEKINKCIKNLNNGTHIGERAYKRIINDNIEIGVMAHIRQDDLDVLMSILDKNYNFKKGYYYFSYPFDCPNIETIFYIRQLGGFTVDNHLYINITLDEKKLTDCILHELIHYINNDSYISVSYEEQFSSEFRSYMAINIFNRYYIDDEIIDELKKHIIKKHKFPEDLEYSTEIKGELYP